MQSSVGVGTRRIEAMTGSAAEAFLRARSSTLGAIEQAVGGVPAGTRADSPEELHALTERVKAIVQSLRASEKQLAHVTVAATAASTPAPLQGKLPNQTPLFLHRVPQLEFTNASTASKEMADIALKLLQRASTAPGCHIFARAKDIVCLTTMPSDRTTPAAGAEANKVLATLFKLVPGRGGGSATRAVGVLSNEADLDAIESWVRASRAQ